MKQQKLDPLCFKDFPMSITSTGYLIPCCYCDDKPTLEDPEFKKLLAVSKISDYDSIEEILQTRPWKRFEKNLKKHQGPPACFNTCVVRENKNDIIRKDTHIDTKTKKVKKIRDV